MLRNVVEAVQVWTMFAAVDGLLCRGAQRNAAVAVAAQRARQDRLDLLGGEGIDRTW